jgi:hypothetical protein
MLASILITAPAAISLGQISGEVKLEPVPDRAGKSQAGTGVRPCARTSSLPMISLGVRLGAPTPTHPIASYPGTNSPTPADEIGENVAASHAPTGSTRSHRFRAWSRYRISSDFTRHPTTPVLTGSSVLTFRHVPSDQWHR